MLNQPLQIGHTRLSPDTLHSLTLTKGSIYLDSQAGMFHITGQGLPHLIRDLTYQCCDKIIPGIQIGYGILAWRADDVEFTKRIRDNGEITPFQGRVPRGWFLFETEQRWSFYPVSALIAIAWRARKVGFLFEGEIVEITCDNAKKVFDSFPAKPESAHYTARDAGEYLGIGPVMRQEVESVRTRKVNPLDALNGFREKKVFREVDSGWGRKRGRDMER
jgi:hypothetical protein